MDGIIYNRNDSIMILVMNGKILVGEYKVSDYNIFRLDNLYSPTEMKGINAKVLKPILNINKIGDISDDEIVKKSLIETYISNYL